MRHLPRQTRVLTTQVNPDTTTPTGRRVLAVGRFVRPACASCGGFETAKVSIDGQLYTVTCTACTAPAAGLDEVLDDVEGEDNGRGFETEGQFGTQGGAA